MTPRAALARLARKRTSDGEQYRAPAVPRGPRGKWPRGPLLRLAAAQRVSDEVGRSAYGGTRSDIRAGAVPSGYRPLSHIQR